MPAALPYGDIALVRDISLGGFWKCGCAARCSPAYALTFMLGATVDLSLAQGASALTGVVTSSEEGPMEGVLVTAKKAGSTIATTVVTGKDGRYSFPAVPPRARRLHDQNPRRRL